MDYEATGNKVNKSTGKNATNSLVREISTKSILWALVKKHRLGLITTYAVVLTVFYLLPFLPSEIASSLGF